MTIEKAEALAATLNDDDDDECTYAVKPDPMGTDKAVVNVYCELGELLGAL